MAVYRSLYKSFLLPHSFRFARHFEDFSTLLLGKYHCGNRNCSSDSTSSSKSSQKIIQPGIKSQLQESKQEYIAISKAMKLYLEKTFEYDQMMEKEKAAYELGRRHLANIMGENPETFNERDIKKAISYLLPSSLSRLEARPVMLEPEKVFPKNAGGNFDVSGRPNNTFFYTMKPNFFTLLYNAVSKLESMNDYENKRISRGFNAPPEHYALELRGSEWVSHDQLEKKLNEKLPEFLYNEFVYCFNNLASHAYSYQAKEFLYEYRVILPESKISFRVPEPVMREDGRLCVKAKGKRKFAVADVEVVDKGSGHFSVNKKNILYFKNLQNREQVMFPLVFTGYLHKVDIECQVEGDGESAQAGAIRHGISRALASFVSSEERERMRIAGLLTRDVRMRERKKPGQKGARAKYPWKKR